MDITKNATIEPDYIRLNPKGVVPTLVDGDRVVCNGPTIARYLDDLATPKLVSSDTQQWAERLENFPLMHLSYSVWVLGRRGERSSDILDDKVDRCARYAETYPELRAQYERKQRFFEEFRAGVYSAEHREHVRTQCRQTLDELGEAVEKRSWVGAEYSFADAIATSILYRLADLELLDFWQHGHPLAAYFKRLQDRRSYRRVWFEDKTE